MIRLPIQTRAGAYEVRVGAGILPELGDALRDLGLSGRPALIADATAFALHGVRARASLVDPLVLEIAPGEASKSLARAARLWDALIEAGVGRRDPVIALGGGVVGDLAGFVAATLHRGVPFVQVPTTLLAQVDSSVGGKVAIDHRLGKNLIGAFHPPRLVVADVDTLATLPARERWSGLAEVVKAALLGDRELFDRLERDLEAIADAPPPEVIARAIAIKVRVVEADEREGGLRRILNLGHTVGHALEQALVLGGVEARDPGGGAAAGASEPGDLRRASAVGASTDRGTASAAAGATCAPTGRGADHGKGLPARGASPRRPAGARTGTTDAPTESDAAGAIGGTAHDPSASMQTEARAPALTHGEAVVLGMRAALHISARHAGLPEAQAQRALALLARFPLPPLPPLDPEVLLAAALRDKKREGAFVHYIVLPELGRAATLRADAALLREAIDLALETA